MTDDTEFMLSVLLIDDETSMLEAMSRMLRARGFTVHACRNGDDAVELLQDRSVDVVVSDVVMEGLVGTSLLQAIRACPGGLHIPVVFMSNMPERRVRGAIDGEFAFIRKPFGFDDLMHVIDLATDSMAQPIAPQGFPIPSYRLAPPVYR